MKKNPTENSKKDQAWHREMEQQTFEIDIPGLTPMLMKHLRELRSPKKSFLQWHVKPGTPVKTGTIIGKYNLDDKKTIPRWPMSIGVERKTGQIRMPFCGVITHLSKSVDDPWLFSFNPLFSEDFTFDYERRVNNFTRKKYDAWLISGSIHRINIGMNIGDIVYSKCCAAIGYKLDKNSSFSQDVDDFLRTELKKMEKTIQLPDYPYPDDV